MVTPAARSRPSTATLVSAERNSARLAAMMPPTPSTAASSSTVAASIASRDPKARATARAPVGPTWRIPSATSSRLSGCAREASMPATRLAADSAPNRSRVTSCSVVRS